MTSISTPSSSSGPSPSAAASCSSASRSAPASAASAVSGLAAEHRARTGLLAHQSQAAAAAGEDVGDQRREVVGGGGEGLLETLGDLAVGRADQRAQLAQRRLQVAALGLELLDALERLAVLLRGQRVDRTERLAPARQALHPLAQHVALALGQLVLGGRRLEAELCGQRPQLSLGLGGMVAGLLGGDLGARHGIRQLAQAGLQTALLAGALAQGAGERLTGRAVRAQLLLHRRQARLERAAQAVERRDEALGLRRQLAVGSGLALEHRDPPLASGAFALDAVDGAALGGPLTLELGAAHRRLALIGGGPALLDQPAGAALVLGGLGLLAIGGAQTGVGAFALVDRVLHPSLRFERSRERRLLLLRRLLGGADQHLAAIAVLERALAPAARGLAQLAERAAPDAAGPRHRGATEPVRQRFEVLDDPGVDQDPRGHGERRGVAAQQLDQRARPGDRGLPGRRRLACGVGDQRPRALVAGALDDGVGLRAIADHRGGEPAAERRGERQLVAVGHGERALQRAGGGGGRRMAAQELVDGRELRTDRRRLAPRALDGAFGLAQPVASLGDGRLGLRALLASLLAHERPRGEQLGGLAPLRGQLLELAGELVLAALLEQRQLGLELLEAHAAGALLGAGLVTQRGQLDLAPLRPRRDGRRQRACLLETHRHAVAHRARGEHAPGDRVMALAALRQRLLGLLPPGRDELHLTLDQLARIAHSRGARSRWRRAAHGAPAAARGSASSGPPATGARGARAARRPRPGASADAAERAPRVRRRARGRGSPRCARA